MNVNNVEETVDTIDFIDNKKRDNSDNKERDNKDRENMDRYNQDETSNQRKSEVAINLFKEGYNCSQAVFLAFHENCGIDFKTALKISSSFGGGMGRLREVCGAVTGMFMVAGMLYGYTDPKDHTSKSDHYERIQLLARQFEETNRSIICKVLLGLESGKESHVPELRTAEYYKKRPCAELVGIAADIMDSYMKEYPIIRISS